MEPIIKTEIDSNHSKSDLPNEIVDSLPNNQSQSEALHEDPSLSILRLFGPGHRSEDEELVLNWTNQIDQKVQKQQFLSVMDHTALTHLLLNLDNWSSKLIPFESKIRSLLKESWFLYLGRYKSEDKLLTRLPRRILRKGSKDEVLLHQSLFHDQKVYFIGGLKTLLLDYIPELKDIIVISLFLMSFFWEPTRPISVGIYLGYLVSSIFEHLVHLYIGHANPFLTKLYSKTGYIGRCMLSFHLEHETHHYSVSSNYVELFAPADKKEPNYYRKKINRKLRWESLIHKKYGEDILGNIKKSNYGLSSSNVLSTHLFFLPFSVLSSYLVSLTLGGLDFWSTWPFHLAFIATAQTWISVSTWYHPHLHKTRKTAYAEATPLMRWFLQTRISSHIARTHRAHHTAHGTVNQNLNPFIALFIGWKPSSIHDIIDLKDRGALY